MLYQRILVPMALDHGISPQTLEIAQALSAPGATITALHVYEAPEGTVKAFLDAETMQSAFDRARSQLQAKLEALPDVKAELVTGHTARTIIDYAEAKQVDCIVIGSHKPGLSDYFLGSTAARVVRHAPCAVHVHRSD